MVIGVGIHSIRLWGVISKHGPILTATQAQPKRTGFGGVQASVPTMFYTLLLRTKKEIRKSR